MKWTQWGPGLLVLFVLCRISTTHALGTAPSLLHMGSLLRHAPPEGGGSATLVADGRRGGPIGPPGEKSGSKLSLPQKLPGGELAAYLGTTDIPVDVMATFGGLGFLDFKTKQFSRATYPTRSWSAYPAPVHLCIASLLHRLISYQ